jgi:hypothetical protein
MVAHRLALQVRGRIGVSGSLPDRPNTLAEQALADVAATGGDLAQLVEELQDSQVRPGTLAGDREILPIPDRRQIGLTTYDAKDPDTSFPPITRLRPPPGPPMCWWC